MTKELVEKKQNEVVEAGAFDFGEDAGKGFEGTTGADLSIPFFALLQANSPQVADKDPKGSESGMIFNTVTRELFDGEEGIIFLPCHKEGPVWVEWVPRNSGGGYVTAHEPESDAVKRARENPPIMNDAGEPTRKLRYGENELIETFYVYGLLLDESGVDTKGFGVISFTSSKIKPHRDWMTALYTLRVPGPGGRKVNPPLYANPSVIRTVRQKNKNDQSYYTFRIEPFGDTWAAGVLNPGDERQRGLLMEAKEFVGLVEQGVARAAFETEQAAGDGESTGSSNSDDPPF